MPAVVLARSTTTANTRCHGLSSRNALRRVCSVYVAADAMRCRIGRGCRRIEVLDARRRCELMVETVGRGELVHGGRMAGEDGAGEMERARAVEE